jgi:hypothetical protein
MIIVLAAVAWIVLLSLIAGLCTAAREGDSAWPTQDAVGAARSESYAGELREHLEIAARAGFRPGRTAESDASLTRRDGVAA